MGLKPILQVLRLVFCSSSKWMTECNAGTFARWISIMSAWGKAELRVWLFLMTEEKHVLVQETNISHLYSREKKLHKYILLSAFPLESQLWIADTVCQSTVLWSTPCEAVTCPTVFCRSTCCLSVCFCNSWKLSPHTLSQSFSVLLRRSM